MQPSLRVCIMAMRNEKRSTQRWQSEGFDQVHTDRSPSGQIARPVKPLRLRIVHRDQPGVTCEVPGASITRIRSSVTSASPS